MAVPPDSDDKVLHGAEGVKTKGEINGKRENRPLAKDAKGAKKKRKWSYVSNILSIL